MKKKATRRSRAKYPALRPKLNTRIRFEELSDFDYFHKLNDSEKEFMNKFLEEYINASVKDKSPAEKKEAFDRNNARNRDVFIREKAIGQLMYFDDINDSQENRDSEMERLINIIDLKKKLGLDE
jgi:hypothetical protein